MKETVYYTPLNLLFLGIIFLILGFYILSSNYFYFYFLFLLLILSGLFLIYKGYKIKMKYGNWIIKSKKSIKELEKFRFINLP